MTKVRDVASIPVTPCVTTGKKEVPFLLEWLQGHDVSHGVSARGDSVSRGLLGNMFRDPAGCHAKEGATGI